MALRITRNDRVKEVKIVKKTQENSIQTTSKDLVKKRNRKRIGIILTGCLAVCIATGVIFSIRHFGSALNHTNKVIVCEETVNLHQHTDECYGYDEDGNEILICGYADYLVHTHNQYCYNDDGELICPLPEVEEHVHDDSCYVEEEVLICDLEETFDEEILDDEAIVDDEPIVDDEVIADEVIEDEPIVDDEILADDVEIIDDNETPLAGLSHQHDASCYETRKVLVCDKLELHEHTPECYEIDENGNEVLVCGKVELKAHQHTAECVEKRELTEEEIAALDKADPNAKTNLAEQFFTKTVETADYIVTVTYNGLAEIPEEAELVVKEVELTSEQRKAAGVEVSDKEENDENTEEASEEDSENKEPEEKATLFKALDICFMLDGVEIEPKAEVTVDVKFLDADFEEPQEMTITHIKDDGTTEVLGEQEIDEYSNISVTTDSFSVYVYTTKSKQSGDPEEKQYSNAYFKYNKLKDAFVNDPAYDIYRRSNGALGTYASNFHIVAFDTAYTNVHTNGNILAKNIKGNANFGTNNYSNELSYIQNIISTGAMETGGGSGKALVVGDSNPIRTEDNNNKLRIYSKDWSSSTGSGDSSASLIMKDLDTDNAPFIDFNNVRSEIDSIQNGFKSQSDVNVDVRLDRNYIKITDPDSAGYCTLKASQVNSINPDFALVGFESGKQGSLIINVDCSGVSEVKLPTRAYVYFDSSYNADGTLNSNAKGKQASTSEVTEFSGGKVIWNLYNAKEGTVVKVEQITGIVLAPNCDVTVNMMNGNIVGKNVTITGESHRTDFTGTTIPFAASLTATKTVDGRSPLENEKFSFTLYEIVNAAPKKIQTVQNNGSTISFDKITYGKDSDIGDHWYYIIEDKLPDGSKYTRDDSAYIIKTKVTKDANNKYNATSEYYKSTFTIIEEKKNVTILTQDPVDQASLTFNNLDSTKISVEKKWVAEDGTTELEKKDLPDSITVKLIQTANGVSQQYKEEVTLTKAKNYAYTWENLPRQDASGNTFTYHVEENPVEGFTQVVSATPIELTEGTYTLTNAKNPGKTSVHIKKKFYLVENDTPAKDAKLEVTDPTLFRTGTYSADWQVIATLYVSADGGNTWDQCWPEVVINNYENLPDDQKIHYTTASGTFTQKNHKASYDLNQADGYEMTITGLPKSGVYKGKSSNFTYKVMERMSCWSIFQYDYDNYTIGNGGAKKPLDNGGNTYAPNLTAGDTKYEPEVTGGLAADGESYDFVLNNFGDGFIDISVMKNWWTVEGGVDSIQNGANDDAFITLELTEKETGEKVATYKLTKDSLIEVDDNGNTVSPKYETEAKTNNNNLWSGKIKHLPKYVIKSGVLKYSDYDFTEKVVSSDDENQYTYGTYVLTNINLDKQTNPNEWSFTLDNKNTESYELPRTGGHGTLGGFIKQWIRKFF